MGPGSDDAGSSSVPEDLRSFPGVGASVLVSSGESLAGDTGRVYPPITQTLLYWQTYTQFPLSLSLQSSTDIVARCAMFSDYNYVSTMYLRLTPLSS